MFQYIPPFLHSQALWNKAWHYWVILLFSIYYSKQSWRDINTIILRRRIQKPFICAWKIWHLMTWNVLAWSRTYFITHHHPPKHCRRVGSADARELRGTCSYSGYCATSSCLLEVWEKQFWFSFCGFKKNIISYGTAQSRNDITDCHVRNLKGPHFLSSLISLC